MKTTNNAKCRMQDWLRSVVAIVALMLFGMTPANAQQQRQTGDFIYVYLKDGDVKAFLREEITEFYYGFEDEEGVTQSEPQMQCIALADSIYKVPLASIDSVSFVTPATVLQPGVTDLAPTLSQYVLGSKEQTLYLSEITPESLLPAVGQRIVLARRGIAGDVVSVSQEDDLIVVKTTGVMPDQIFKTHYAVSITDFEQSGTATATAKPMNTSIGVNMKETFKLPPLTLSLNEELLDIFLPNDTMPDAVKFNYTTTVQPTFTVKASLIVNNGTRASVSVVGDFDCNTLFKFNGKAEYSHDFYNKTKDAIDQPLGETLFFLYNRWGAVFKAAVELDVSMKWKQLYHATFDWSYNSKAKLQMPRASFKRVSADYEPEGTLKGSIALGPFTEVGIKWVSTELAKACLRAEGPVELVGTFVLNNKTVEEASGETKLYEALKDSKIELNATGNTSIQLSFVDTEQGIDLPLNGSLNLATWHLVPEFKNTALEQKYGAPTTAIGSVAMTKRDLIIPVEVGLRLFDKDGLPVSDWKSANKYNKGARTIEHQFDGLDSKEMYKVQPTVKLLAWDMLANPSAPIERDPFPVRIVSFEQTGSHYSKQQGYEYEGKNYFYKFNATTTVELNPEAQHIKDWGYIYHDFYGVDKKISCANLGSNPYADMRYAYYYNDRERTVELSPYVQYDDGNDILVGRGYSYYVEYTIPVHITGFQQTGSQYSKDQSFVYEGKGYSYKFNVATTVELDDEEPNVKDWGYIYHDFYGVDKKISCANLGSNPYVDTRYAYYYNEPKRTVELSPYIQYNGEDITEGRKTTFNLEHSQYEHYCPDNNHPHWIDLGLPSGTKWCCCNEGASMPHEYGGYYAWGETHEKSIYTWNTYQYYTPPPTEYQKGTLTHIGADISGSGYDPCDVGRMPTQAEQRELFSNTNREWSNAGHKTMLNGVNGIVFTGKNGNKIFLPYCGYKDGENLVGENATSRYWTGTATSDYARGNGSAAECYTYYGGILTGSNVCLGYSVRPVR